MLYPTYKITKPIRLIELFSGYGSQALALKYLGINFEHWKICEWAVKSIQAYKDIHFEEDTKDYSKDLEIGQIKEFLHKKGISSNYNEPMNIGQINRLNEKQARTIYNNIQATHNLVNIQQVKGSDLEMTEREKYNYLVTYSFPCFTKDSIVLTNNGYKYINEVKKGDKVLTHNNRYKEVINTFDNGVHDIYKINAMGVDEIKATSNHKFYVREMYRKGYIPKRYFKEPTWKELKYLSKKDYLGVPINQYSIIPEFKNLDTNNGLFWWIIGRYFGDGWYRSDNSIIICCGKTELDEITSKIDGYYDYKVYEERTTYKVYINEKDIGKFVLQFGKGAINKTINNVIMNLPIDLLEEFLKGYFSADGCKVGNTYKATSISRQLVYGIGMCVSKVYHTPYRIYKCVRPKKYVIEGREVNQHDTYQIVFKKEKCKQDKAFYEDDYIWYPIKDITYIGKENVYDIEVEDDHSFTVQNTIVHNCQDLSLAGKTAGMKKGSGTRSGMLWEVERILEECGENLPQILLMENVPQVANKKNKEDFDTWVEFLESKGYTNKWCMLNAKEVGYPEPIPQNRNRCFMVSVLNPKQEIIFPKKTERKLVLKDLLENNVDEKYYLSDKMKEYIFSENNKYKVNKSSLKLNRDIACSKTTREGNTRADTTDYICDELPENYKLKPVMNLYEMGIKRYNRRTGVVIDTSGSSSTLLARTQGDNNMILIKNATKQGYLEATDGDGIDLTQPNSETRRGRVQKNAIQTLTTQNNLGVVSDLRIRKLTPRECFRLMGVKDEDFDKVAKNQSDSSLYHLAGDSIVCQCLEAIFKEMIE
jgi:DNA-cytosine methyltransferase